MDISKIRLTTSAWDLLYHQLLRAGGSLRHAATYPKQGAAHVQIPAEHCRFASSVYLLREVWHIGGAVNQPLDCEVGFGLVLQAVDILADRDELQPAEFEFVMD